MFIRETSYIRNNKKYTYLKLVKNYRENGKVKQKVIANLGNLDSISKDEIKSIIKGLYRYTNVSSEKDFRFLNSYSYGDVAVLLSLWQKIGLKGTLEELLEDKDIRTIFVFILHRLLGFETNISTPKWVTKIYLQKSYKNISLNEFYQAMDNLITHKEKLESTIISNLKYLDNSKFLYCGLVKSLLERQIEKTYDDKFEIYLGLLLNQEGYPITHSMLMESEIDKLTPPWLIRKYLKKFPGYKIIYFDILRHISNDIVKYMDENNLKYVIDLKKARNQEIKYILSRTKKNEFKKFNEKLFIKEKIIDNKRYIICYYPELEKLEMKNRNNIINWGHREIMSIKRVISKQSSYNKAEIALKKMKDLFKQEKNLRKYYSYWIYFDGTIFYEKKQNIIKLEEELDGLHFFVTNELEIPVINLIKVYEDFIRLSIFVGTIKNFLRTRSMHHYSEDRIKAHIFLTILAYILQIELSKKLEKTDLKISSKQALEILSEIKISENELSGNKFFSISEIKEEQRQILQAFGIRKLRIP